MLHLAARRCGKRIQHILQLFNRGTPSNFPAIVSGSVILVCCAYDSHLAGVGGHGGLVNEAFARLRATYDDEIRGSSVVRFGRVALTVSSRFLYFLLIMWIGYTCSREPYCCKLGVLSCKLGFC